MTLKKSIRKIHLWFGLASGLVVFILGITGCIYAFIDEIKPIVYRDRFEVDQKKKDRQELNQLMLVAREAIGKEKPITGISVRNDGYSTVRFMAFKSKEEPDGIWFWDQREYYYNAYVNPYAAKVQKVENGTTEFFQIVLWLHWALLLKTNIGQPIVGTACLIFVISLITGLVLWKPRNKKVAKQRLWFRWKPTTKWRRKNYDLHNILGFYLMIFALLIGLTGLVWAFDWFDDSVQWVANGGKTIESKEGILASDTSRFTDQKPLNVIYQSNLSLYPEANNYFISIPRDSLSALRVFVNFEGRVDDVTAYHDQYTGELLKTMTFDDKNNGQKARSFNYDIHVGSILGLPGKILAFLASLVSASLPITGFYIWWGRKKKKKKGVTRKEKTERTVKNEVVNV